MIARGREGDLVLDFAIPLGRLIEEGTSVYLLDVEGGVIARANRTFETTAKRALVGTPLAALVVPGASEELVRAPRGGVSGPMLVQFRDASDQPFTLRCVVDAQGGRIRLAGEPPAVHHRRLEEQLAAINSEMAVLLRENTRQTRALAEAHRQLESGHWHLEKISEVLPICLACRQVHTGAGDDAWETVEKFLERSSTFLSHGYCARCARRVARELEEPEEKP